jgi:hypothetical protein
MKAKPNTDQFKIKKDPSAFLEGGAADVADRLETSKQTAVVATKEPVPAPEMVAKVHREQKVFRLPLDLINTLKRESYERSMKTGSRVTETELVEQALRGFFK